jgi:8-oxo-dGTP diphosphatase
MTGEEFAEKLGVAVRTVRDWSSRPDMKPRQALQQALDTMLEQAPDAARTRFRRALALDVADATEPAGSPAVAQPVQALTVAIALVMRGRDVLLVCRRGDDAGGISWQFPAGVVKPSADPGSVAVRETLAETGVHCSVRSRIGRRLHPVTGVYCEYFLCDYLTGEAENKDVVENVDVMWVSREQVTRFIPEDRIYRPLLDALMEPDDEAAS